MTSIESGTVEGVCCKMLLTTRQMIISVINQLTRCPCDHVTTVSSVSSVWT